MIGSKRWPSSGYKLADVYREFKSTCNWIRVSALLNIWCCRPKSIYPRPVSPLISLKSANFHRFDSVSIVASFWSETDLPSDVLSDSSCPNLGPRLQPPGLIFGHWSESPWRILARDQMKQGEVLSPLSMITRIALSSFLVQPTLSFISAGFVQHDLRHTNHVGWAEWQWCFTLCRVSGKSPASRCI